MNTPPLELNALGPITADGVSAMNVMWPEIEPALRRYALRIAKQPADLDVMIADAMDRFWYIDATRYDFRKRNDASYAIRALINHIKNQWPSSKHGPLTMAELVGPLWFGGTSIKPDPVELD